MKTNAGVLARLVSEPDFVAGEVDTGFIEARLETLATKPEPSEFLKIEAVTALAPGPDGTPWSGGSLAGFRMSLAPASSLIQYDDEIVEGWADPAIEPAWTVRDGTVVLFEGGEAYAFSRPKACCNISQGE